jgi:hypothetical protein
LLFWGVEVNSTWLPVAFAHAFAPSLHSRNSTSLELHEMAMVTWAWAWARQTEAKPDDRIVAAASFLSFLMEC